MNRLDGKVALISGAARGIGAETARLMAEAGAKIAVGDVLDERGRETARAIESAGAEAIYTRLDVTREEHWTAAITAVTDRFGGLDILVNNAGVFLGMSIEEATLADWHRLCAVNLTGVFLGTKLALPALRESAQIEPARQRDRQSVVGRGAGGFYGRSALLDDEGRGHPVHQIGGSRIRAERLPHPRQLDPSRHDRDRHGGPGPHDAGSQPRHE